MQRTVTAKLTLLQPLLEVLVSLNLALAVFYYVLVRHFVDAAYSNSTSDAYAFLYYFFRAAVRLNRLLHYQPSGYEKYVRWPNAGGRLGVELAFALTTIFLGVLLLTVLRLARNTRNYSRILRFVGGLVFPLAFPLAYLVLFGRSYDPNLVSGLSLGIPEVVCAAVLCFVYLLRPFSPWGMGIALLLHYGFWALLYHGAGTGQTLYGPIPPWLLLLLIPIGGAVWLWHCEVSRGYSSMEPFGERWSGHLLVAVAISVAGLGAMWLPGRGYALANAKNRDSLTIEMRHSGSGVGPEYRIMVHGDGATEYVGERFVKVRGEQTSFLNEQQMQEVLAGFDRADFFSLEDQAFAWGYHGGRVSVRITVDGKTKEVTSDMYHVGAKTGLQAKFVDAAANIDKLIGTDRWVKCDDTRCQP
jgi:Domain of unknown function (DUF6438)